MPVIKQDEFFKVKCIFIKWPHSPPIPPKIPRVQFKTLWSSLHSHPNHLLTCRLHFMCYEGQSILTILCYYHILLTHSLEIQVPYHTNNTSTSDPAVINFIKQEVNLMQSLLNTCMYMYLIGILVSESREKVFVI